MSHITLINFSRVKLVRKRKKEEKSIHVTASIYTFFFFFFYSILIRFFIFDTHIHTFRDIYTPFHVCTVSESHGGTRGKKRQNSISPIFFSHFGSKIWEFFFSSAFYYNDNKLNLRCFRESFPFFGKRKSPSTPFVSSLAALLSTCPHL